MTPPIHYTFFSSTSFCMDSLTIGLRRYNLSLIWVELSCISRHFGHSTV